MKIRAKANGMLLDLSDTEANAYLLTGLYEKVEEEQKSTKVKPMGTESMPTKKGKK